MNPDFWPTKLFRETKGNAGARMTGDERELVWGRIWNRYPVGVLCRDGVCTGCLLLQAGPWWAFCPSEVGLIRLVPSVSLSRLICVAELALGTDSRIGATIQMLPYLDGHHLVPWPSTLLLWSVIKFPIATKITVNFPTEMETRELNRCLHTKFWGPHLLPKSVPKIMQPGLFPPGKR